MLSHPLQMKRIDYDFLHFLENALQIYANDLPILASTYKCLRMVYKHTDDLTNGVFNTNIAQSSRVLPNGTEYHIFHCARGTCSITYPVGKQCFVHLHFTNNFVIMFIYFDLVD